jgi:hypothetical protein
MRSNSGLALVLVGAALVGLGSFAVEKEAVGTGLVVIGAAAMVLAVLLPRSHGQLKLGPGGLEVYLSEVERLSEERGLDAELRAEAVTAAFYKLLASRETRHSDLNPTNVLIHDALRHLGSGQSETQTPEEFADEVVEDVSAMVDVPVEEVPDEAIEAVRVAAETNEPPTVAEAQRRPGRGAPRWSLWTNLGRWRVSNTRHGWNTRRID